MPWEKQFDRDAVLDKAMNAFWANGYDGTPMADLLDEMGIQKGSFYATFGSKRDVFLNSLDRFVQERFAATETMIAAPSPRQALIAHLHAIAEDALSEQGCMGCMVANAAVELAPKDDGVRAFVHKTFDRHMGLYRRVLDAAVAKGELPETFDSLHVARGLLALVLGLRVLARAGMPAAVVHSVRDQALALIGTSH
jgi:TetR/AcrR family transcriptional regulator, transcriptional repressor for nem operon